MILPAGSTRVTERRETFGFQNKLALFGLIPKFRSGIIEQAA